MIFYILLAVNHNNYVQYMYFGTSIYGFGIVVYNMHNIIVRLLLSVELVQATAEVCVQCAPTECDGGHSVLRLSVTEGTVCSD